MITIRFAYFAASHPTTKELQDKSGLTDELAMVNEIIAYYGWALLEKNRNNVFGSFDQDQSFTPIALTPAPEMALRGISAMTFPPSREKGLKKAFQTVDLVTATSNAFFVYDSVVARLSRGDTIGSLNPTNNQGTTFVIKRNPS